MTSISGIAGLTGREPIAAALAVGVKGPTGAPVDRDRFHVLEASPHAEERGGRSTQVRGPHPSFAAFAGAPPERRRAIPAQLAHATVAECFEYRRQAQTLAGIVHPRKAPVCRGDGVRAERYDPKQDAYVTCECPGDRCPYAQPQERGPTPCKPWMRFLARFDWPRVDGKGLPNVPFKYASGSWNTVRNFVGFFESFRRNCEALGLDPSAIPLFGLPVTLQLQERTDPGAQRRFPVVSISVSGDRDLLDWIGHQQVRLAQIGATVRPVLALADLSDSTDYDLISAGPQRLPGE